MITEPMIKNLVDILINREFKNCDLQDIFDIAVYELPECIHVYYNYGPRRYDTSILISTLK